MTTTLAPPNMKAFVSIAKWYPKDETGEFASINSVYQKIEGTPQEVGRHTLSKALDGKLDRGHFDNLVKLAQLCSKWSSDRVTIDDLVVVED